MTCMYEVKGVERQTPSRLLEIKTSCRSSVRCSPLKVRLSTA